VARIFLTHYSDPGCPWAYSANPALTVLRWRYGDQLVWRHVMIGLSETPERYEKLGMTPRTQAQGYRRFRARGMPFATEPRPRMVGDRPRLPRDRRDAAARAGARVQRLPRAPVGVVHDAARARRGRRDRGGARGCRGPGRRRPSSPRSTTRRPRTPTRPTAPPPGTAAGGPTEAQGRAANSDGAVRFTAPSVVFETEDGRRLEAGGFQPLEAYDVCLANLDPTLDRRPPASDIAELLAEFPWGITTREVALCMAERLDPPDDAAAEDALIEAGRPTRRSAAVSATARCGCRPHASPYDRPTGHPRRRDEMAGTEFWRDLKPITSVFKPDAVAEAYISDAPTDDERYYVPLTETVGTRRC
jgi:hypothetical protein